MCQTVNLEKTGRYRSYTLKIVGKKVVKYFFIPTIIVILIQIIIMETYNIKYEIHLTDGSAIRDKEMNVKNCTNGVGAQVKLENLLKKKYSNFKQLIVHSCKEDVMSMFNGMFGMGGDGSPTAGGSPFGGSTSNPFGDIFGDLLGGKK
jgi:hypothetical protein